MTSTDDPDAAIRFTAAYHGVYADALRFVQRRLHPDTDRAEDVVAEAMTTAWRRLDSLPNDPDDIRAWIFGITRHCLLNDRRSRRRQDALGVRLAFADGAGVAPDGADEAVGRADLARAWNLLSPTDQEALSLTVFEGLDSGHAGQTLGISATAYRARLARARATLRRHLHERTDATPAPTVKTSQETR